jgi:hypothetical protein
LIKCNFIIDFDHFGTNETNASAPTSAKSVFIPYEPAAAQSKTGRRTQALLRPQRLTFDNFS